jgi:putative N-acetyltransferase (TIGR04045 family)
MRQNRSSGIICRPVSSSAELRACLRLRNKVFVDEQHLFNGSDGDAYDDRSIHLAALCNGEVIGTVRIYARTHDLWFGGRLAVEKHYRGRAGKLLVNAAVHIARQQGARRFLARVQARNVAFFKSLHWKPVGHAFEYAGTLHQICEADLTV